MTPQEAWARLQKDPQFQPWRQQHPEAFLTHFFSPASLHNFPSLWEIGFYLPPQQKMTVFVQEGPLFLQKPEDEIFRKPKDSLEPLLLEQVKITGEAAQETCRQVLSQEFSHEQCGDGFIILQQVAEEPCWNFTFLCKSLAFINVKLNALTGAVQDKQRIEVVSKQ